MTKNYIFVAQFTDEEQAIITRTNERICDFLGVDVESDIKDEKTTDVIAIFEDALIEYCKHLPITLIRDINESLCILKQKAHDVVIDIDINNDDTFDIMVIDFCDEILYHEVAMDSGKMFETLDRITTVFTHVENVYINNEK